MADAVPPSAGPAASSDIPDWLSERMREDAEQDAHRQRSRLATRRALGWSAAATVLAMLAVAGYWFYQDSRVDGALNVVANTSPAAPATLAPSRAGRPAAVPVAAAPLAAPPSAQDKPGGTPPAAVDRSASTAATETAAPAP